MGCSWFDRLTTSVGTDIGAQPTRPLATFSAIALTLAPMSMAAQVEPSPTQGVVKKGKVPVSSEILKINLPKPTEAERTAILLALEQETKENPVLVREIEDYEE